MNENKRDDVNSNSFKWEEDLIKTSKIRSKPFLQDIELRNYFKSLISAMQREIDEKGRVNRFGYLARCFFGFQSTIPLMDSLILTDLIHKTPANQFEQIYRFVAKQKDFIVKIRGLLVADHLSADSLISEKNFSKLRKRLLESQNENGFFILKQPGGNKYEFQPRIPLNGDLYVQLLFLKAISAVDALEEIESEKLIKNVVSMQNKDGGFRHCLDPMQCSCPQGKDARCSFCNAPNLRTKINVFLKPFNQTKWSSVQWTSNAIEILKILNGVGEIDLNDTTAFILQNQTQTGLFQFNKNYNFTNYYITNPNIFEGVSISHTYIPSTLSAIKALKNLDKMQSINKKQISNALHRYKIKEGVRRTKKNTGAYSTIGKIPEFKYLDKKYRRGFETSILVNNTYSTLRTIEILNF